MKRRDLVDIIGEAVGGMVFPITILEVTAAGDQKRLKFCDTMHAQINFFLTINDTPYKILAVGGTIYITINTSDTINAGDIAYLYKPKFTYGTPVETATETAKIGAMVDGFPLSWLRLNFTEKINKWNNTTEREADIDLYFLTLCKHGDLTYQDLHIVGIIPMRSLAESFVDYIQSPAQLGNFNTDDIEYSIDNYEKLGIYIREKGSDKQLIGKNLTGVCLSIKIKLYRGSKCLDCSQDDILLTDDDEILTT